MDTPVIKSQFAGIAKNFLGYAVHLQRMLAGMQIGSPSVEVV
jgi:hypothetical protein